MALPMTGPRIIGRLPWSELVDGSAAVLLPVPVPVPVGPGLLLLVELPPLRSLTGVANNSASFGFTQLVLGESSVALP